MPACKCRHVHIQARARFTRSHLVDQARCKETGGKQVKKWLALLLFLAVTCVLVLPGFIGQGLCLAAGTGSWRISPGTTSGFGVGNPNNAAVPLVEFKDKLYAGVTNQGGAQVWRKGGNGWTPVVGPAPASISGGFGDANNMSILRMHAYGDYLYAGTINMNGCQVWRSGDGYNWVQVVGPAAPVGPGFNNANNLGVTSMEVFNNKLYVGVINYVINIPPTSEGSQIWAFDGSTWKEEAGAHGGFGDTLNAGVTSMRGFGGTLYAGTMRFELKWIVKSWSPLLVQVNINSKGCELRKKIGSAWPREAGNGFTDTSNLAVTSMDVFSGQLCRHDERQLQRDSERIDLRDHVVNV